MLLLGYTKVKVKTSFENHQLSGKDPSAQEKGGCFLQEKGKKITFKKSKHKRGRGAANQQMSPRPLMTLSRDTSTAQNSSQLFSQYFRWLNDD